MDTFASFAETVLPRLAWASVQATLLISLLWLVCRALPRLPATTRCLLWWLLGAQLLVGLLAWQTPVQLPLLPAAPVTTTVMQSPPSHTVATQSMHTVLSSDSSNAHIVSADARTSVSMAATTIPWRQALLALWLAGLLMQCVVMGRQWQRTRRIRRTSKPSDDARLCALCANQSQRLGLRHCPELRISDAIDSPQVTGLWHPCVLLPNRHALTPDECAMALAHELSHLRRGDLWLGWIPTLARWLFFFHPLVHLAVREYALNRETACDGRALRLQQAAPQAYGQLLLRLGVERPLPAGLTGVASPSFRQLKRRLTMLQHTSGAVPRARDWLLVALIALAFIVPYRVVAASPAAQGTHQNAGPQRSAPAMPPMPPVPPLPPPTLPAPPPPLPPPPPNYGFHATQTNADIDSNARFGLALFDGGSLIINGTHADAAAIKRLHQSGQPLLWFHHGDKTWLTHDKAIIKQARRTYAPVIKLARQQGRLAGKQGMLAGQQAALAARDVGFAERQSALAQRKAALAQRKAALQQQDAQLAAQTAAKSDDAVMRGLDARRQALDSRQAALATRQHSLAQRQTRLEQQHATLKAKLTKQRHALDKQKTRLKQQQKALAQRQQQTQSKVGQAMQQLLEQATAKGTAKQLHGN